MPSTTREFPLTEEMKKLLNVTRIHAEGKVLFVENARVEPITCLYTDELISTVDALKEALTKTGEFDGKSIDEFIRLFINVWRDLEEESPPDCKKGVTGTTVANAVSIQSTAADVQWTPAFTADRLFLEMCSTDKKAVIYEGTDKEEKVNWYYAEAATYAQRASAGNFAGKNAKYKPVFHLDQRDFSPEVMVNLVERLQASKESLHRVVEDAVFMIFRARHPMIFYQRIEAEGLRWRFV